MVPRLAVRRGGLRLRRVRGLVMRFFFFKQKTAYEIALDYAKTREQFGRPIIDNQAIAFALADMKTGIDASRLLVWRAAWVGQQGKAVEAARGAMAKLYARGAAGPGTRPALQNLRGHGPTRPH